MATGKIIYKDISELEQKQIIAGNEKLPISENEFITPEQIVAGVDAKADDLQQQINNKYEKPSDGIPNTDMSSGVRQSLGKADTAYQKPGTGIPKIDMTSSVQMSLNMADSSIQPSDLTPITEVIPAQASSENKLADKAFVNSSIATNAATFRGTFNSVAELEAYMGAKDNNDYAFVIGADSAGNTTYSRYKYDGTAWVFEYTLNNSSFTSAQWAAINSGISSEELADILTDVASKQDTISDLATIRSGAAAGATAYQKPGTGIPATDLAAGVIPDVSAFITKSVNDLTNYYLKSETYAKTEVDAIVGAIQGFSYESVSSLPTASASTMGKIYLVPSADAQTQNVKDEFITIDNGASAQTRYTWEQIGSTAIDLSDYVTDSELAAALADYVLSSSITDVLRYSSMSLTDAQKTQARTNIGAGTYSKPSGGIPASDIAEGVIPTVPSVDNTPTANSDNLVKSGGVYSFVGNPIVSISAPTPNDGTLVFTHLNGDTDTVDLNHNHPQYYSKVAESTQPVGGFLPDVVYVLGELSGSVTFALASTVSGDLNHYFWTFETGVSAPTVTWPAGITWLDGSAPTPGASKHCEVSILGGVGVYMEA